LFADHPRLAAYQDLKPYAERAGDWSATRDRARRLAGATFAYVVRGGVVRTVAVAEGAAARSSGSLRAYLRRIPRKAPARRPPQVVTSAASEVAPGRAVPLAASGGAQQFPFFCGIQPPGF
jgi:hypothetical protein